MFGGNGNNPALMSALAGIATLGAAPSIAKRAKKLPEPAREELKALQKRLSEERKAAIDALFAQYPAARMLSSKEMREIRAVVDAFIVNLPDSHSNGEVVSTGNDLTVKGAIVAERTSPYSRFIRVCPGEFGADVVSRRAANALLDALGAGISVRDREGRAFLTAKGTPTGRLVSGSACHTVEVNKAIRNQANANMIRLMRETGADVAEANRIRDLYEKGTAAEKAAVKAAYESMLQSAAAYNARVASPAAPAAAAPRRRRAAAAAAPRSRGGSRSGGSRGRGGRGRR